jgi:CspA family cold shock protein
VFVALVVPFDSLEGAAKTIFAAFFAGLEVVRGVWENAGVSLPVAKQSSCHVAARVNTRRRVRGSRSEGTRKWFNASKGFEFMQRLAAEDVRVYFSAIMKDGCKSLAEGQAMEFEAQKGPQGLQAENVTDL